MEAGLTSHASSWVSLLLAPSHGDKEGVSFRR